MQVLHQGRDLRDEICVALPWSSSGSGGSGTDVIEVQLTADEAARFRRDAVAIERTEIPRVETWAVPAGCELVKVLAGLLDDYYPPDADFRWRIGRVAEVRADGDGVRLFCEAEPWVQP